MVNKRFIISPELQLSFLDILSKNPYNPTLFPQNTCSILFCRKFLTSLFVYFVEFGNIMWKLENRNFYGQLLS